jgi:hypothetical protein
MWIFLIFQSSKICVNSTSVVSSLFHPRFRLSSNRRCHAITSCHTSFRCSQGKLVVSTSSSDNALSCHLPSWAENEVLNPHHRHRPPSSDRLTLTLHWYKNVISTLTREPRHRSSTRSRYFLSPSSHAHHPSAQWHLEWWTRWPAFASRIAYLHVNSRKIYFKISQHRTGLSTSSVNLHGWK